MKLSGRLAVLLLVAAGVAAPAWACGDCGGVEPACAAVEHARVVFLGTVVFTNHDPSLRDGQDTLVRFEVEEIFKGLAPGTRYVWADPGSFSSCYFVYSVGERWLVFSSATVALPHNPKGKPKPLPAGIDPKKPPVVYWAPLECEDTRPMTPDAEKWFAPDLAWLRQYRNGAATRSVTGRVREDDSFGMPSTLGECPGLAGVTVTLSGKGLVTAGTQTDSVGYYHFDHVPPGRYTVSGALPQYTQGWGPRSIEVPREGYCGFADLDMVARGVVEGLLLDHKGGPLPNVTLDVVRIWKDGKPAEDGRQAQSDASGRFRFDGLPSGEFEVGVNLSHPPSPENPYETTHGQANGRSRIHLAAGQHVEVSPLILPPPSRVRGITVEVRGPDGRLAHPGIVSVKSAGQFVMIAKTDAHGIAHLELLERILYEVKVFAEIGYSNSVKLKVESKPLSLRMTLAKADVRAGFAEWNHRN